MKLLAIDTSSELATVALTIGDEVYQDEQGSVRQHAQFLLPMVQSLLARASVSLNQLDGIVFGCGPGSFTGLRITTSIVKALAYAHDLPLFPVSSLAAIANEVYHTDANLEPNTHVLAMLDARMQQVYWGCFTAHEYSMTEQVSDVSELIIPADVPIVIAGVGLDAYVAQFAPSIKLRAATARLVYPQARAMIRLVQAGYIKAISAAEALPVYVREPHFKTA